MEKDIKFFIDNECPCLASKKHQVIWHAPLGTITSALLMDIIAIDFLKVDRTAGGYEYFLVIIDNSRDIRMRMLLLQTNLQKLLLKTFQWFCSEIRNTKLNPTRPRERNLKKTVWRIREVFWKQLTRYVHVYATTNKSTKTAAEKLFNDFILKFGTPNLTLHAQWKETWKQNVWRIREIFWK